MIRPLRDRIVVRPMEQPRSSVIELVSLEKKLSRGEVIQVGPKAESWGVSPGDVIQFTDLFRFPEVQDSGERLLVLQAADILFVEEALAA